MRGKPLRLVSSSIAPGSNARGARKMATAKAASIPHLERTAHEPRDLKLHHLRVTSIISSNALIRLIQLSPTRPAPPIRFLPGQWLDVHIPSIPKAGGFTITSSPSQPFLELAIQCSPGNPAAAWLWRPKQELLGNEVSVRVGGAFVWPPTLFRGGDGESGGVGGMKKVVFLAGGVGVNPLMSMVTFLSELKAEKGALGFRVVFLYSAKAVREDEGEVLFLRRLRDIFEIFGDEGELRVFLTGSETGGKAMPSIGFESRRINESDLFEALGPLDERKNTVCYICSVPTMTDHFVEKAKQAEGMAEENVLCERWW